MKSIFLVSLMLFFIGCGGGSSSSETKMTPQEICENEAIAYEKAIEYVRVYIKYDKSSAKFPIAPKNHTYLGDCKHKFYSSVEAKNGFGVYSEIPWFATIEYIMDSGDWVMREEPLFVE